jgi:hypothetical protein
LRAGAVTLPRRIYRRLPLRTPRINQASAQSRSQTAPGGHEQKGSTRMSRTRFTRTIGLGITIAALGASSAAAQPIDGPKHDAIAAGRGAITQYTPTDVRTPDSVPASAPSTSQPVVDLRTPDARDHGQGRGTFNAPEVTVIKLADPVPTASGFDWADAGIGAGGLLGLILVGLGGTAAVAHRKATPRGTATT